VPTASKARVAGSGVDAVIDRRGRLAAVVLLTELKRQLTLESAARRCRLTRLPPDTSAANPDARERV
jgi:hypothetical protein